LRQLLEGLPAPTQDCHDLEHLNGFLTITAERTATLLPDLTKICLVLSRLVPASTETRLVMEYIFQGWQGSSRRGHHISDYRHKEWPTYETTLQDVMALPKRHAMFYIILRDDISSEIGPRCPRQKARLKCGQGLTPEYRALLCALNDWQGLYLTAEEQESYNYDESLWNALIATINFWASRFAIVDKRLESLLFAELWKFDFRKLRGTVRFILRVGEINSCLVFRNSSGIFGRMDFDQYTPHGLVLVETEELGRFKRVESFTSTLGSNFFHEVEDTTFVLV
jgi:hypothetical protein